MILKRLSDASCYDCSVVERQKNNARVTVGIHTETRKGRWGLLDDAHKNREKAVGVAERTQKEAIKDTTAGDDEDSKSQGVGGVGKKFKRNDESVRK